MPDNRLLAFVFGGGGQREFTDCALGGFFQLRVITQAATEVDDINGLFLLLLNRFWFSLILAGKVPFLTNKTPVNSFGNVAPYLPWPLFFDFHNGQERPHLVRVAHLAAGAIHEGILNGRPGIRENPGFHPQRWAQGCLS